MLNNVRDDLCKSFVFPLGIISSMDCLGDFEGERMNKGGKLNGRK